MADSTEFISRIPARPILSLDIFRCTKPHFGSVLDVGQVKLTLNARTALAVALRHAGIGCGSSVLVPAYHCPAMVTPIVWLGAEPVFYPIQADTTVPVEVLAKYVRPDTRALIAVHYFGFIQDLSTLRDFCEEHDLVLIEDCAHAFFGYADGKMFGRYGDYAIASIMKFLPVYEGGCLVSSRRDLSDIRMHQGNLFFQCKSALNVLELSCNYGRLPWLNYLLVVKNWLWGKLKRANDEPIFPNQDDAENETTEFDFDPSGLHQSMSWSSIAIMKTICFAHACVRRRENYNRLLRAFSNIPGGRPLYGAMPDSIYPQVFPMVMDEPESVFFPLKSKGVPIIRFGEYRWHGVDTSTCPVSAELSRRVFQFPCHQSLTDEELDWMIETVLAVLKDSRKNIEQGS